MHRSMKCLKCHSEITYVDMGIFADERVNYTYCFTSKNVTTVKCSSVERCFLHLEVIKSKTVTLYDTVLFQKVILYKYIFISLLFN